MLFFKNWVLVFSFQQIQWTDQLCKLTLFAETKSVTKSRLHCTWVQSYVSQLVSQSEFFDNSSVICFLTHKVLLSLPNFTFLAHYNSIAGLQPKVFYVVSRLAQKNAIYCFRMFRHVVLESLRVFNTGYLDTISNDLTPTFKPSQDSKCFGDLSTLRFLL